MKWKTGGISPATPSSHSPLSRQRKASFKHFFFSLLKPVTSMESVRNDLQEAAPLLDLMRSSLYK
jgi:hypothetical protein